MAIFAKGTELKVGDGATPTEVFTLIPGIRTITGPSMSAEVIDITSHDTPGGFRDKMQGLKDWGVLSLRAALGAGRSRSTSSSSRTTWRAPCGTTRSRIPIRTTRR